MTLAYPRLQAELPQPFRKSAPTPSSGNLFKRWITARVIAHVSRDSTPAVAARLWPHDRMLAEVIERAASSPAMTTVSGWALELAQRVTLDTIEALGPVSAAVQLIRTGLVLSFDGRGLAVVPGFVADANYASFVAEGQPIPVRQLAGTGPTLGPHKIATIAVLTREMIESSNAEALISDTLVRSAGLALDAALFGVGAATAAQPAGIRNGIAALTASSDPALFEAALADIAALLNATGAVGGPGPYVLIANPGRIVGMGLRYQSSSDIIRLATPAVGNDLIAVAGAALAAAISAEPDVETANAASLHMDSVPSALGGTVSPTQSLWQTDTIAIKVRWPASWALRDSRGVAWLTPAWK